MPVAAKGVPSPAAPVDVDLLDVEVEVLDAGDGLAGKGFVDFPAIDVANGQTGPFQRLTRGGHGTVRHDGGLKTDDAPRHNASQRLVAVFLGLRRT